MHFYIRFVLSQSEFEVHGGLCEHSREDSADSFGRDDLTEALQIDQDQDNETDKTESKLDLLQILRHFAVYTGQHHKDMTYLLTLLKLHEPTPCYSMLPNTGKQLVHITGRDFGTFNFSAESSKELPAAVTINNGKYLHFGVESALNGESPGVVHRDADLLQFVDVYLQELDMLPKPLLARVSRNQQCFLGSFPFK